MNNCSMINYGGLAQYKSAPTQYLMQSLRAAPPSVAHWINRLLSLYDSCTDAVATMAARRDAAVAADVAVVQAATPN